MLCRDCGYICACCNVCFLCLSNIVVLVYCILFGYALFAVSEFVCFESSLLWLCCFGCVLCAFGTEFYVCAVMLCVFTLLSCCVCCYCFVLFFPVLYHV